MASIKVFIHEEVLLPRPRKAGGPVVCDSERCHGQPWDEVEVPDKKGKTKTEWRPRKLTEEDLARLVGDRGGSR